MLQSTAWSLTILIPFALALESAEQAELSNKKTNHMYGYAIYGFWGGVVLFGILRKLMQQVQIRSTSSTRSDVEDFGSADLRGPLSIDKAGYWSRAYFTTPSAFGTYRARPLFWCTIPTRIEAIVIVAYWILSIVLCGVGYVYYTGKSAASESLIGSSLTLQQWNNFGNRCAVLALSNLPVLWIFAGRNSVFLWATGWSFQTFNIFHRHIARVVILLSIGHASAHTHVALITQLPTGHSLYEEGLKLDWYVWGIVAATSMGIFWLTSMSWIRRKSYEVFLLIHIGLGIVVIYAIFRHTTRVGGAYNGYLWALVAIWSFDRLLRVVRLFACNLKLGHNNNSLQIVSTVAEYHPKSDVIKVRVQTSGLRAFKPSPGQHCFLYQPLSLRFWESHPFTVGSWSSDSSLSTQTSEQILSPSSATEKDCRIDSVASTLSSNTSGPLSPRERNAVPPSDTDTLTFWIRPYDGWTRRLRDQCAKSQSGTCQPRLLAEGPYGHSARLYTFDTVVFIAGGTGVSAVLPYIKDHVYRSCNGTSRITDMRLAWASRKASFVQSVCSEELSSVLLRSDFKMDAFLTDEPRQALQTSPQSTSQPSSPSSAEGEKPNALDLNLGPLAGIEYQNGRPYLATIIDTAVRELRAGGRCAVFVCGPASMADDARAATHAAMKAGACRLEYFEDSFGW